jgi:hypothetical protein
MTTSGESLESSESPHGRGQIDDNSMPMDLRENVTWPGDESGETTPDNAPGAAADVDSGAHDPDDGTDIASDR